jgi:hypothetical protein
MGPVFFQAVVGAVIPFEIAIFSLMYLTYRRKNKRATLVNLKNRANEVPNGMQ